VQQEAPETVNEMIEAWLLGNSVPFAKGTPPPVPQAPGAA
jgi:hypothetical protein